MNLPIKNISIIGTGNVAFQIATAFFKNKVSIKEIVGRNEQRVAEYSKIFGARPVFNCNEASSETDLLIIAVSDHAIEVVAKQLKFNNTLVVHTSGSVSMDVLKISSSNTGVFYPLQTFTKDIIAEFSEISICIEGSDKNIESNLTDLAKLLTNKIYYLKSEERKYVHLAAVISNNFINYMMGSTFEFLQEKNIDPTILMPLLNETIDRVKTGNASKLQTGPARRNDTETIAQHLQILKSSKDLYKIYEMMSQEIQNKYNGEKL
jgi:predicted short-subunit dehydrogenase-like oxidoreductase (DUF2520 family)